MDRWNNFNFAGNKVIRWEILRDFFSIPCVELGNRKDYASIYGAKIQRHNGGFVSCIEIPTYAVSFQDNGQSWDQISFDPDDEFCMNPRFRPASPYWDSDEYAENWIYQSSFE